MPGLTVVAFYTRGTPYEDDAELLRASLERVGMQHRIVPVADRGDWDANTAYKPTFLRDLRNQLAGPLLALDVDAFVHRNCAPYFEELAAEGADVGAHWFAGPKGGHDRTQVRRDAAGNLVGWWMLSGTVFLGDTPGCRKMLDGWIALTEWADRFGGGRGGDQRQLWFTIAVMDELHVARLPGRFAYVFDKPWAYPPDEPCIIEHTIASREHRGAERANTGRRARLLQLRRLV